MIDGLKPYPAYKDSGAAWLGEVPGHWEIRRLKSLVRGVDQGVSPQAENALAEGDAWGVVKAGCVNHGLFRESQHKRLSPGFAFDPRLAVAVGDVLVSRASGSPHLVGSTGRVSSLNYKLILSDKTFRPQFTHDVDPDFMVEAMNSPYYRRQVEQAISGADGLANNLPLLSLRAFVFLMPSLEEQRAIATALRATIEGIRRASAGAGREIDLLREYRTRLIADVVTGKLDVREAAAGLPEEPDRPDEPEPLDAVRDADGEPGDDLDTLPEETLA
jgi:type I restriction enzyme S subunit